MTVCIAATSSIVRYVNNDITSSELAHELGEQSAGMLSSGMMALVGQIVLPVPFLGAAVGGMIGYTLAAIFYQVALEASINVEKSHENYLRVLAICDAARHELDTERAAFNKFIENEFRQLYAETKNLFLVVDNQATNPESFARSINDYAQLLGKQLEFKSMTEFESFMKSDQPLRL